MTDIRNGSTNKPASSEQLKKIFEDEKANLDGALYIGYPVFYVAGESVSIDALWVSPNYGAVVFDLVEGVELGNREAFRDDLYGKMQSQLVAIPELKEKRDLAVPIEVLTFAPGMPSGGGQVDTYAEGYSLIERIRGLPQWGDDDRYKVLLAQVQSTLKLRSAKNRTYVKNKESKGAIIRDFEATIANLDQQQEKAVIESVDGIQRIRGLAGSGKTVILALKAAYFHSKNPDWDIVVTFHTRSLKQQFESLIKRFCIEKIGKEPDWSKLRIMNSWGSPSNPGVYSEACRLTGSDYYDYGMAKGARNPFDYVVSKLSGEKSKIEPCYDVVLVDEAQDLPISYLKLCYSLLRNPKRLVYAYDEMQTLNEGPALPSPKSIFGADAQDITLRCCYRNPRPSLVTAHAVGLGIYREKGMVQFFNQPELWHDVGYEVESGRLEAGADVILYRPEDTSPDFFEKRVSFDELIKVEKFNDEAGQSEWVVKQIINDITEEELLPSDILVISPDALATKKSTNLIRTQLLLQGISSHIAGELNADIFTREDSVAFSGIYRAKGNEAAVVYIINSQHCFEAPFGIPANLIKRRNTLFTAITRSKAWVNICGVGERMADLSLELDRIKKADYKLKFNYPTSKQIDHMNVIHRDISQENQKKINQSKDFLNWLQQVKGSIESGETFIEDYPEEVQEFLRQLT
jgi:superfamily I DNA and RNA helicase